MNTALTKRDGKFFEVMFVDSKQIPPYMDEIERFHALTHARGAMLNGVLGPMFDGVQLDLEEMHAAGSLSMICDLFELIDHTTNMAVFCALAAAQARTSQKSASFGIKVL